MSEKEVRTRLKNLPPGLDEAYKETVERIQNQAPSEVEKAMKVLTWICFSKWRMAPLEIQYAVAVEYEKYKFDETNITCLDDLVSLCAGLVAVDVETNVIRLEHYTTQEYFERNRLELFPYAEYQMTATCVSYLFSDMCQRVPPLLFIHDVPFIYPYSHSELTLFRYADTNWSYHARNAYPETKKLIRDFLELVGKIFQNEYALALLKRQYSVFHPLPINFAALLGLDKYIVDLLKHKPDEDSHDSLCERVGDGDGNALLLATHRGEINTAKVLLQHGWKVNATNVNCETVLHLATRKCQTSLNPLLLEHGADIEHLDRCGRTPLLSAALHGESNSVMELLSLGAKTNVVDIDNRNILHYAAKCGSKVMMELCLSDSQCDISALDFCDVDNMAPLLWAVDRGEQRNVDLLITYGVNVNAGIERKKYKRQDDGTGIYMPLDIPPPPLADNNGLTPLHFAALTGDNTMTEFLLSRGAVTNVRDGNGDTPLHLALRRSILDPLNGISGRRDTWSDLLHAKLERNAKIKLQECGRISDHLEAKLKERKEKRMALVEGPLEEGDINVDIRNTKQESPLHLIHYDEENSGDILCKIMTKSQSIFTANDKGQTPLHLSCPKGNIEATRMMLDVSSCSIEDQDLEGQTPFFYAARTQNDSMIEMFSSYLEKKNPNQWNETDLKGRAPFQCYLELGLCLTKTVELFLNNGSNINLIDKNGHCPLSIFLQPQRCLEITTEGWPYANFS
jgi:ankyrin repeat protein